MEALLHIYQPGTLQTGLLSNDHEIAAVNLHRGIDNPPLISCLMVTRGDPALLETAIGCFNAQTYPNRELVVVHDQPALTLAAIPAGRVAANVRLVQAPSGLTLGELRNLAVEAAAGAIVCQWDDDDLYHADRLWAQASCLIGHSLTAVFLRRWLMWWPDQNALVQSNARVWEGSLMGWRALVGRYPALRSGEDTRMVEGLCRTGVIGLLEASSLYAYVVHSANTGLKAHFEQLLRFARRRFDYPADLIRFSPHLPFASHKAAPDWLRKATISSAGPIDAAGYFIAVNHPDIGRNDPCPCGSGARYKHCHGGQRV